VADANRAHARLPKDKRHPNNTWLDQKRPGITLLPLPSFNPACPQAPCTEQPPVMRPLNDLQLADLLDELGAAIECEIPVTGSLRRIADQQRGRLARVAASLLTCMENGESLEASFGRLNLVDQGQLTAAIRGASQTGNSEALRHVAETLRTRHELKNTIRLNWFYPCVLTVVAYTMFVLQLAPTVRENEHLVTRWPTLAVQASFWVENAWWIPPCVACVLLGGLGFQLARPKQLPTAIRQSLFYSTLASQLDAQVPETQAIRTAALMAGEDELAATESASFSTPRVRELMNGDGEASIAEQANNNSASQTLSSVPAQSSLANAIQRADLRRLALEMQAKARRREVILHRMLPQAVSFCLGLAFILGMVLIFIAPIYAEVS